MRLEFTMENPYQTVFSTCPLLVMVHNLTQHLFSIGNFLCRVTPIRPNI